MLHTHNALNNRRNSIAMTLKTYFKLGLAALLTLLVSESDSAMAQSNQAPERVYQTINATDEPVRLTHGWVHTPNQWIDSQTPARTVKTVPPPLSRIGTFSLRLNLSAGDWAFSELGINSAATLRIINLSNNEVLAKTTLGVASLNADHEVIADKSFPIVRFIPYF